MCSTKKCLPVWAASCCAISRAPRSVGPPGAKPTMTFTGRSGQVFAETASAAAAPVAALARLAASKQDAKARWVFMILCPRETSVEPSAGRDYDSAGTAFLGIRAVFAGKTALLQVYGAAGCPIYD